MVVGFMLGATIGSFLNVVVYRVPRGISLSNPNRSFCPKCKHVLEAVDLFPLFSWLAMRGHCRHCGAKVTSRYFFVELLNAVLWGVLWWQNLVAGNEWVKFLAYAAAASILVVSIFTDLELFTIPDQVNVALWLVGLAYGGYLLAVGHPAGWTWGIPSAIAGSIIGVAILWGIAFLGRLLFRKDAMGHGDIKMARGIGAVLFPMAAVTSFALAVAFGAVLGALQLVLRRRSNPESAEDGAGADEESEEGYEPESIGSLLKSGLGYLIGIDAIGLVFPKLYLSWFGEDPYLPINEEDDDWEVGDTMIPFGPYLALGALACFLFYPQLQKLIDRYVNWVTGAGTS